MEEGPPPERPAHPGTPRSTISTNIKVVLVIVLIFVACFTCAYFAIWLNPTIHVPTDEPKAYVKITPFNNPYDLTYTTNMGGWSVEVIQTSGPFIKLSNLTIQIYPECVDARELQHRVDPWIYVKGVNETTADLPYVGSATGWYLFTSPGSQPRFVDNGVEKPLDNTTAMGLYPNSELKTVENTTLIYVDVDGNGYLSAHDLLMIFSDFDADGNKDVRGDHCLTIRTIADEQMVEGKIG